MCEREESRVTPRSMTCRTGTNDSAIFETENSVIEDFFVEKIHKADNLSRD